MTDITKIDGGSEFPAPIYRDTVLRPVFEDAKRYFFSSLLEVEYVHTLMLARQKIMPAAEAAQCLKALDALDRDAIRSTQYNGSFEDLFFYIEKTLADACGDEIAGKMHTARSRNDIDLTMYRMVLRGRLLQIATSLLHLRRLLLGLASEHHAAIMPAYTHNQPAQPTTLGHYLMAYVEVLERDVERIRQAYSRVNRNPLGACAITTTGFPIDRTYTERLLGFEGLQTNSYGAIAAVDYVVECCGVLATSMVSLGRFAQDLLLWSTAEFGYLRLSDAYVQISSIMPQKRNPVPLEHVRILASRALFEANAVTGSLHNTPFADMNDAEDDLQPLVYTAFDDADRSIRLITGTLSEARFNLERMAAAAESNFLTVTELADTIVRRTALSFHSAHGIVSSAVRELGGEYDAEKMADVVLDKLSAATRDIAISREEIRSALSTANFIAVRKIQGGPAPEALSLEIERAELQIGSDKEWLESSRKLLTEAQQSIRNEIDSLIEKASAR